MALVIWNGGCSLSNEGYIIDNIYHEHVYCLLTRRKCLFVALEIAIRFVHNYLFGSVCISSMGGQ